MHVICTANHPVHFIKPWCKFTSTLVEFPLLRRPMVLSNILFSGMKYSNCSAHMGSVSSHSITWHAGERREKWTQESQSSSLSCGMKEQRVHSTWCQRCIMRKTVAGCKTLPGKNNRGRSQSEHKVILLTFTEMWYCFFGGLWLLTWIKLSHQHCVEMLLKVETAKSQGECGAGREASGTACYQNCFMSIRSRIIQLNIF